MTRLFRRRRWRVAVATVLGLAAAELGLRIYARCTHNERGLEWDSEWGWRMVPGAWKSGLVWGGANPSRINSHGWRDEETSYEKPQHTRRMVVVGDSFTLGPGVDFGARFTELLEETQPGFDVVNLGMSAVGPDQELLHLQRDGLRYQPEIVLCAVFEGNDFTDVSCERNGYWPKPYFRLEGGELELVPPAKSWDVRLRTLGYVGEAIYRLVQGWTAYRVIAPEWRESDTQPLLTALLARMDSISKAAGARFAVFVIRSREFAGRADALVESLHAARIPVIDAGADLCEGSLLIPDDGHWNEAGHRAAAELLNARIRALGWW